MTSLCYAVARLRQKNAIDVDDAREVIGFYNEQLLHLSQLVSIPRDPRDLAFEEVISSLKGSAFKHEFVEVVKTVCKTNVFVRLATEQDDSEVSRLEQQECPMSSWMLLLKKHIPFVSIV